MPKSLSFARRGGALGMLLGGVGGDHTAEPDALERPDRRRRPASWPGAARSHEDRDRDQEPALRRRGTYRQRRTQPFSPSRRVAACRVPRRPAGDLHPCASTSTNRAGSSSGPGSRSPKYGFCTTADEARDRRRARSAARSSIKSQVLTGGRMKAGGVKFADTPDEAAEHAAEILELEIGGHMPVGVLVDPKAEVEQEYYAAVLWDGRAQPADDAVQRHGRDRHRAGRRGAPRPRRPRPSLEPPPHLRLPGQGDRRPLRDDRLASSTARPRSSPASPAFSATST